MSKRFLVVISLLYILVSLGLFFSVSLQTGADTKDFEWVAQQPLLSDDFLFGIRPALFPLILKLFAHNEDVVTSAQLVFSIAAWIFLAYAVASSLSTPVSKAIGFTLVLLFSLSAELFLWNRSVLTESLTTSIWAVCLALWIIVLNRIRHKRPFSTRGQVGMGIALILSLVSLALVRDTNAYLILGVAALLVIMVLLLRKQLLGWRILFMAVATACVVGFFAQNYSADRGQRWLYPLVNVLCKRVLTDSTQTEYMVARGLPPELMACAGKYGYQFHYIGIEWLLQHSKTVYMQYLITHPLNSTLDMLRNSRTIFARDPNLAYFVPAPSAPYQFFSNILYPADLLLVIPMLICGGGILYLAWKRALDSRWIIPVSLFVLLFPVAFIVWHGDALEIPRHSLLLRIQLRFLLWYGILLIADVWLQRRAARKASGEITSPTTQKPEVAA